MDIGPGDWVECIESAGPCFATNGGSVEAGRLYRISSTGVRSFPCAICRKERAYLRCDGDGCEPGTIGGWCVHRFRPVYRPKSDLIESLKRPAPKVRAYGPGDLCINGERVATVTHVAPGKSA